MARLTRAQVLDAARNTTWTWPHSREPHRISEPDRRPTMLAADLNAECGVTSAPLASKYVGGDAEKAKAALRDALDAGKIAWLEDDYARSMQQAGGREWMGWKLVTVELPTPMGANDA